jgi:hypothetical protein
VAVISSDAIRCTSIFDRELPAVDRYIGVDLREGDNIAETDCESGIAWGIPVSLEFGGLIVDPRLVDVGWYVAHAAPMNCRFMKKRDSLAILVLGLVGVLANPCGAQTPSPEPAVQNQAGQLPQAVPSAVVSGQAGAGPTSASAPGMGSSVSSSIGKRFGSAGRELPGMPGGLPIKGSMGSQDPSSRYMSPPVIPSLFCDPSVNIPC